MIANLIYSFIISLALFFIQMYIYQLYFLKQQQLYAYIKEIENKNKDILIQTKVKIIKKMKFRCAKCILDEKTITIPIDNNTKTPIDKVYVSKNNKYYISPKSKKDIMQNVKFEREEIIYKYKLKDRDYVFEKKSNEMHSEQNLVIFKNPFSYEYYWEEEIKDSLILTEIELIKQIPPKMDKFFFNYKNMNKLLEHKNKNITDSLSIFAFVSLLTFICSFILSTIL